MAGKATIDFIGTSWVMRLEDDTGRVVDMWELDRDKVSFSAEARKRLYEHDGLMKSYEQMEGMIAVVNTYFDDQADILAKVKAALTSLKEG